MKNVNPSLNSRVKKPVDFWLVLAILGLLGMGTMMVFSSSSSASYVKFNNSYELLTKQILWVVLGLLVMAIVSRIDYRFFTGLAVPIFGVAILLLILVLIPGVGHSYNNARRWFSIAGTTIQPSEIMKLGIVLLFASMFENESKTKKNTTFLGFLKCLGIIAVVAGLLYFEPHVSCAVIVSGTAVIIMYLGGTKLKHFGIIAGAGAGFAVVAFTTLNHVNERFSTWLNPFDYANDEGYQVVQSLLAIGSGGLTGKGLGQSVQKYLYLPEPYNDFIFSILAEELGFIGCLAVIILFGFFIIRGYKIAIHAPDKKAKLVAAGITTIITIQVIMNIAVVTSSIPVTGISLPFFSYGGSSLVIMMINMGILLNISSQADYEKF